MIFTASPTSGMYATLSTSGMYALSKTTTYMQFFMISKHVLKSTSMQ